MKSNPRLAITGLLLAACGVALILAHWLIPGWMPALAAVGALPLVIGLLLLGVAEEQGRKRAPETENPTPTGSVSAKRAKKLRPTARR